ncbi:hypothetical protein [Ralstonia pseudosolanacearum]|uniref:hypothetical protein n=1 Tax=Ralstonia pseudosolanacearum TaxID=1310165 RepID=UPI001FFA8B03|nr:hypothetical protein [Ralstonia pseudosolanacearum]
MSRHFGEVCAAKACQRTQGEVVLLPASDAAPFLFRVSLAGYDFAQVAVKRVPQGYLPGFGPIEVDADGDVGFRAVGPLLGLLPCVERAVDGLVSALANFGAPIERLMFRLARFSVPEKFRQRVPFRHCAPSRGTKKKHRRFLASA